MQIRARKLMNHRSIARSVSGARTLVFAALACTNLVGCDLGGAPSYSLFGAHFPASLLCVAVGFLGSLVLRAVLIALGIEAVMPLRLLVYTAFAASTATWTWLSLFGDR